MTSGSLCQRHGLFAVRTEPWRPTQHDAACGHCPSQALSSSGAHDPIIPPSDSMATWTHSALGPCSDTGAHSHVHNEQKHIELVSKPTPFLETHELGRNTAHARRLQRGLAPGPGAPELCFCFVFFQFYITKHVSQNKKTKGSKALYVPALTRFSHRRCGVSLGGPGPPQRLLLKCLQSDKTTSYLLVGGKEGLV